MMVVPGGAKRSQALLGGKLFKGVGHEVLGGSR